MLGYFILVTLHQLLVCDLVFAVLHCVLGSTFSWSKPFICWPSNSHTFPLWFTGFDLGKVYKLMKPLTSGFRRNWFMELTVLCVWIIRSHEKAKEAIIYSYNKHVNGFAASLEEEEAAVIASEKISSVLFNSFFVISIIYFQISWHK